MNSWKVRKTVVSDGTEPNRSVLQAQVLDVGTALPAAGQHQRHLDEHLAAVVQRESFAVHGMRADSASPRPNGRQMTQVRAVRRGPPPRCRRVPQPRDACC